MVKSPVSSREAMTYLGVHKLQGRGGGCACAQKSAFQTSGPGEEMGDEQMEPERRRRWWKQLVSQREKEGTGQAGATLAGKGQGDPSPETAGMQGDGHPRF